MAFLTFSYPTTPQLPSPRLVVELQIYPTMMDLTCGGRAQEFFKVPLIVLNKVELKTIQPVPW